jgi:hypothetical protein
MFATQNTKIFTRKWKLILNFFSHIHCVNKILAAIKTTRTCKFQNQCTLLNMNPEMDLEIQRFGFL